MSRLLILILISLCFCERPAAGFGIVSDDSSAESSETATDTSTQGSAFGSMTTSFNTQLSLGKVTNSSSSLGISTGTGFATDEPSTANEATDNSPESTAGDGGTFTSNQGPGASSQATTQTSSDASVGNSTSTKTMTVGRVLST